MTERVTLEELAIPETLDGAGGAAFREMVGVRNTIESAAMGSDDFAPTAEELLPLWRNTVDEPKRLLIARVDGVIVGRGVLELPTEEGSTTAFVSVEVLPDYREAGIGTAMLEAIESWATAAGRSILESFVTHGPLRGGPELAPPTGFGAVPADSPEVRFALGRGYRLEQVARMSMLDVDDVLPTIRDVLDAAAAHAAGYVVETAAGIPPQEWWEDLALLQRRMSTDAPAAGLELDEQDWDADRVLRTATDREEGGRTALTAVARDTADGRIVAFSELLVPSDPERAVVQDSTLVLSEHRGHRLGMLVKAANLVFLHDVSPASRAVTTFNAEENRPMLDVNEALGFHAVGAEGAWRKDL
ncbi:GNAT family N-acetyltransferase [Labedella phragmitis]|uniref:GNAT family N-acetyltransferase n=1 Tax=Labedella phragmitis TaxID=2498849 RepID=A0A3S4BK53_9MICO|nr:GNAT family N-acetyltransferase [Labedella phragmitis]RWZ51975.1 GNAT family N-acetyltransferase [Labedella phragmitis]